MEEAIVHAKHGVYWAAGAQNKQKGTKESVREAI